MVLFPDNSGVYSSVCKEKKRKETIELNDSSYMTSLNPRSLLFQGSIFLESNIVLHIGANTTLSGAWPGWNYTWEYYPKVFVLFSSLFPLFFFLFSLFSFLSFSYPPSPSLSPLLSSSFTPPLQIYSRGNGFMGFIHASLVNGGVCLNLSSTPTDPGDQCLEWKKLESI